MKRRTYIRSGFVAVLMVFALLIGGGTAYANVTNGGLDGTGDSAFTELEQIAATMVIQINEYGIEVANLELEVADLEAQIIVLEASVDADALEIAALEAQIVVLNDTIDSKNLEIATLTSNLQDITDERDWLFTELTSANDAAIQFQTDICAQVDLIASDSKRAVYDTWCGVRP